MSAADHAYALLEKGRLKDALAVIEPWAKLPNSDNATLVAYAVTLKHLGRRRDALEISRLAAHRFPGSGLAWRTVATMVEEEDEVREAIEASQRALAAEPGVWFTWARTHELLGEFDHAEHGYRKAIEQRPEDADAIQNLAHLMWMRTGDLEAAVAVYDEAPWSPLITVHKARLLRTAGFAGRALETVEDVLAKAPRNAGLLHSAAQHSMEVGRYDRALVYAAHELAVAPESPLTVEMWAGANLAAGRFEEALRAARHAFRAGPDRPSGIAVLAACARAANAPEYEALYDYEQFVRPGTISPPNGWATLEEYLSDLKAALDETHAFTAHPIDQSLRNGTQSTRDVRRYGHPAIDAFFTAVEPLVQSYMEAIGSGADPLRRRNTGGYEIGGAWSVRLRPSGYHIDHIHPQGWLSSAFYVETPRAALDHADREGWIKFGVPGLPMPEKPEPAHYERPVPGKLVLFPSYMWHGTVPFTTDESRLTIAFDIVPA